MSLCCVAAGSGASPPSASDATAAGGKPLRCLSARSLPEEGAVAGAVELPPGAGLSPGLRAVRLVPLAEGVPASEVRYVEILPGANLVHFEFFLPRAIGEEESTEGEAGGGEGEGGKGGSGLTAP